MPSERTRRKVKVGRAMQALRERLDPKMTPEQAATHLKVARTTVTRMEGGLQLPNRHAALALLAFYGATDEERDEVMKLWDNAKQDTTQVEHAEDLTGKYVAFRRDERDAVAEFVLQPLAVHG